MLWEAIKLAFQTVGRNALRSILTLLGIVIGVGAVIALVTIGQGTTDKLRADLSKLGSNMLIARPGGGPPGPPSGNEARTFTDRDVQALRGIRNIRAVAPSANRTVEVVFGTASSDVQVTGTEPGAFIVQDWGFTSGGPFSDNDVRSGTSVCVIGSTVASELLQGFEPVGQIIRVGSMPCEIIGVLESKGQSAFGQDQDNTVMMPMRTFHRRVSGNTRIAMIAVSAESQQVLSSVQAEMTEVLRETRRVRSDEDDDFSVRDMTQLAATLSSTTTLMTGLLGAVAAVSLLVGGIGIMNIMLVSVTERTREIGIRLAIGALSSQVLLEFLVEAVVLCMIGGLIGIALGLGLALLASVFLEIPFLLDPRIILGAFLFSGLIGVVFGFFPARRAANLDPIDALRRE